jgi:hypothetical protein
LLHLGLIRICRLVPRQNQMMQNFIREISKHMYISQQVPKIWD